MLADDLRCASAPTASLRRPADTERLTNRRLLFPCDEPMLARLLGPSGRSRSSRHRGFREVLTHELLLLWFRGPERLCLLPEVRHEAAERMPRLRLSMRTGFRLLPEVRRPCL